MNAARSTTHTNRWIMAAALVGALALAGCDDWDDDDEDYTETYQNCQVIDYGDGEQYKLCCTTTCYFHYDEDEYTQQCQEDRTCSTPTGSACPNRVIEQYGYPPCFY
jgi:hypothetical protein